MAKTRRVDYEKIKTEAAARRRDASRLGRDIGSIPPVRSPKLRRECDKYLQAFCEILFPNRFTLEWSPDHLTVLNTMQNTIQNGGRFALAMPRGRGKTSIVECAGIWAGAALYHRYLMLIGATKDDSTSIIENIQVELSMNEDLGDIYPEICYPFQALQGEARRAKGQLHHGKRTHIGWAADEIRFPMIPGSKASGVVIQTSGIEGHIRGRRVVLPNGDSIRPTLAILDDIQTDESAYSETQCATRRRLIDNAVGGLSGSGESKSTTMIFPCTVIRKGDLADELLDRELSPQWRGIRTKMMTALPENDELWGEYDELMKRSLREREDTSLSTDFYIENREEMDKGAEPTWTEQYKRDEGEISAIQHAMNILLNNEHTFWAEYQNEPLDDTTGDDLDLKAVDVAVRVNGIKQRVIPTDAELVTSFIDVQGKLLYYTVVAWDMKFGGSVVDYGVFPDQRRSYYTLKNAKRTLGRWKPGVGLEAQLYAGLVELTDDLCGKDWIREDGTIMKMDLCMIDQNWHKSTDLIHKVIKTSDFTSQLMPSNGKFYGASTNPVSERTKKRGDKVGLNWFVPPAKSGRARICTWDTNFWKSFFTARLATSMGDPGALTLYGKKPDVHRMLSEQLTSEKRIETEGRGRKCDEWKLKKIGMDNHLFDCGVGCAVAASIKGAAIKEQLQVKKTVKKRVKLSQINRN